MDINPSIEYTLNRQNHVIKVKGLNEEGQEVADELVKTSLHNATLEEALEQTKLILSQKNYLNSDAGEYVLINVSANNIGRMDTLQKEALSAFSAEQTQGKLNLVLTGSTLKEHKTASSLGISTGTYQQIQYIKAKSQKDGNESPTDIKASSLQPSDIVEYKNYTVSELLESSGQNSTSNNVIETSGASESSVTSQSSTAVQEEKNNQKSLETDSNKMPESSKNNKEQSASQTEKNESPKNSKDKSLEEGQSTQNSVTQQSNDSRQNKESQQSKSPIQSGELQQNNSSIQGNEPKQNDSLPQSNDSNNTSPQSNDSPQNNDSMQDNTPGSMR